MESTKVIMVGVYMMIAVYLVYRIFIKRDPYREEYERLYNEILNSDKYKVKGQHDK